jgi:MYXO-CTERM domain-containing protein
VTVRASNGVAPDDTQSFTIEVSSDRDAAVDAGDAAPDGGQGDSYTDGGDAGDGALSARKSADSGCGCSAGNGVDQPQSSALAITVILGFLVGVRPKRRRHPCRSPSLTLFRR